MSVVVAGGGIAGLAAARRLARMLPRGAVTLVEAEPRLGGKIVTERVDGFVIEGGPDSFLASKPRGVGLCREVGLEARLQGTNPAQRRTYVLRHGRLHDLPEGLSGLVPMRLGPLARTRLISPVGKVRMGLEYFIPPRRGAADESLAQFVRRRLGREAYANLIEPLLSGIYAGDGEQLSLGATFPQLRQREQAHGGLIRAVLAQRRAGDGEGGAGSRPAFLAPLMGLAELVEAVQAELAELGVAVRLGTHVTHLRRGAGEAGYRLRLSDGDELEASAVVLATPAYASAALVHALDSELAAALQSIPYVSSATISLAYPESALARPLDGYGYLVPRDEGRAALACTWTSAKWQHRAPAGYALLRVFVGRAGQADVLARSDDELAAVAQAEVAEVLGIRAQPRLRRVFRWPRAMPQYVTGHLARLALIEQRQAGLPGLALAGSAYRGVGLPDCIASGETAADRILSRLGASAQPEPSLQAQG